MTKKSPVTEPTTTSGADGPARRRLPEALSRAQQRFATPALMVFLAVLVAYAFRTDSQLQLRIFSLMFLNATLAVGLVLPLGLTGLFSLSQGTAYGVGAYTSALMVERYGLPFEVAIVVAVAMAAVAGFVLGLTSLRVKGHQFALVSMAATIAASQVFSNWGYLGGREGYSGLKPQQLFGIHLESTRDFYLATLGAFAAAYVVVRRVSASHAGRAMRAVGHDEVAAATLGVSVRYQKLLSVSLGSAVAGLAGAFMMATVLFVAPKSFDITNSFSIAIWVIVGGMSSVTGAAVVAGLFTYVTEKSRQLSDYRIGLFGLVVIVVLFVRTGVVSSNARTLLRRIRRRS